MRRYCAANRLNRFGTLTYAGEGCHNPVELRGHVAGFFRQLRSGLNGVPLPYAWAAEWHPGGHGLHVHFAVGRYVPHNLIRDVWGRGRIHIKLIGDLPAGSGSLEEARKAGSYLGKYVGKAFDARLRQAGLHRYEVAQGFQPEEQRFKGSTVDHVVRQASALMGSAPERVWRSSREHGWERPPAVWCAWGAERGSPNRRTPRVHNGYSIRGVQHELADGVLHLLHEAWSSSQATIYSDRDATAADAARVAREAGAADLTLIHLDPRLDDLAPLLADAAATFERVVLGEDEMTLG